MQQPPSSRYRALFDVKAGYLFTAYKINQRFIVRESVRLSTKSRYGLRALFDIAYNAGNQPAQIKDIFSKHLCLIIYIQMQ